MIKLVNILKIKLYNGEKIKIIQLFGKNILYIKKNIENKYTFSFVNKINAQTKKDNVFYLKIHTIKEYSLECFQKWIDIAHLCNAIIYIVCDDEITKKAIYKTIKLYDSCFEIISSKTSKIQPYVKAISCQFWYNAVAAKLAIFFHAKVHGYTHFWKIDADDTMFLLENNKIVELLKNAENLSKKQNIKAFSLDMHTSKLYGKHWSFGVCYIDNTVDWLSIFKKYMNNGWKKKYEEKFKEGMNLDWFFTYLRDENVLNIKSFYINNTYFYHYGDKTSDLMKLYFWKDNLIVYPFLKIFSEYWGQRSIFCDNVCIGNVLEKDMDISIKNHILKEFKLLAINSIYDQNLQIMYPPQGLGDILLVCGLIHEYKKTNPAKKIIMHVTKKHFYDLAKLYCDDCFDVTLICDDIKNYTNVLNLSEKIYKNKSFYEIYENNDNFKTLFINSMNISKNTKLFYPKIKRKSETELSSTILIAPDSVSCPKLIGDELWINLADKLSKKGYNVIFNSNDEKRFGNYKKVFWDIQTTIQKVNNMKAFISYRSGLSDVIGAFCRDIPQYVLYPSKIYNMGNFSSEEDGINAYCKFCSIKDNFNNELVKEYIFNEDSMCTIFDQIGKY